jgi:LSD1 subclass zinc finger protein
VSDGVSAIRCTGCGAGLEAPPGAERVKCAFCGMEHALRPERARVVEVEATRIPAGGADGRVVGLAVERALLAQECERRPGAFGCLWVFVLLSTLGMVAGGQWRAALVWGAVLFVLAWAGGGRRRRLRRRIAEIDRELARGAP